MPHHSSSLIAAVLLGVVGYSVATEPLVAGAAGQRAPQLVQVDPHEVTALDLEQICEHYPWLTHCQGATMEKRKSAYMRFGRSAPSEDSSDVDASAFENFEKRKSAYMRFGKRFDPAGFSGDSVEFGPEMAKRKSAYMRFGKRKSAYMRFGKRSDDVSEDAMAMEKRKSAYMRFGRR